MARHIGFLIFPQVQELDLIGPHDVFASLPDTTVHLVSKTREPVRSTAGLLLTPDCTYAECPPLDVLCVPGGDGVTALLEDRETLAFVQREAQRAAYVTSVCTGSLLLGAAGMLRGRRATTHWAFHELLPMLGATPVRERVVRDGNLFTGGGVTAGIDFALTVAAELVGANEAQAVQLELEYAPAPPFDAGSPETAPAAIVELLRARTATNLVRRRNIVERIAAGWAR